MILKPPAAAIAPYLRIGTCSWKYPSWKGLLYKRQKHYRPQDYLHDYAQSLDSVEVDQWFWSLFPGQIRLPDLQTVKQYSEAVPEGFVFTVKAPIALILTHFYSRQPPATIVRTNAENRILTYVNVNNHLKGSAPLTIQRLLDALAS